MAPIISHIYQETSNGRWKIQTNEEHSKGVATLASRFAGEFGMESWGHVLGLLHDKGKETHAFQQHIRRESGYEPETKVSGDYHHAYIGGILAHRYYGRSSDHLLVNPIISHHTGLHDSDELAVILGKDIPKEVETNLPKWQLEQPPFSKIEPSEIHHLTRMLYSCLVDADYLDTESFMNSSVAAMRGAKKNLDELLPLLEKHLTSLSQNATKNETNAVRKEVQELCANAADSPIGFYSLTVPTGGGKTLASLLWAMKHAVHHKLHRVIIAIPYTSIIMQTASVLRGIFGKENVLEHHSGTDPEDIKDEALRESMKLATENWDYPIVVTTNVQLFESMFANKPSACRKLHHLAKCVVILDEVQTLPTDYLQPIVDSLKAYNHLFSTSILFTTASQPVLSGIIEGCNPSASFKGIEQVTEIIPPSLRLHERLRRVQLEIDDKGHTYDDIAACLCRHKRVLCIVNTRRDAREIFKRLPQVGITLHLSRMMCSEHISQTISCIKSALKDDSNEVIRVVSTQLVEAGVDIDFPVVYRQEAGLDSVLQAAGRCNREGHCDRGTTYVFSLSHEHNLPSGHLTDANNARKNLGIDCDWFAPETMTRYFKQLYCRKDSFDKHQIKGYLGNPCSGNLSFSTAARSFHLIEDNGTIIYMEWGEGVSLIQKLMHDGPSYPLMKKLARYSVSLHQKEFAELQKMGAITEKLKGVYVMDVAQQYDEHLGLLLENQWEKQILIQ